MQGSHTSSYGVKYQARCLAAQAAELQRARFLVGTLSLREENEVHLIEFSENGGDVTCEGLYSHPAEIWDLAACPFDAQIFSTVFASAGEFGAKVWRMPDRGKGGIGSSPQLQAVAALDGHKAIIKCTLWWPSGKNTQILSIDAENLYVWDLDTVQRVSKVNCQASVGELQYMAGGRWDPHDVNRVATSCETSVQFWDLRSMKQTTKIDQAHAIQVRDIDFNPKKANIIVTCGDDSKIRLWDTKMPGMPLQELPGHSHWTVRVRYNPKYDEIVLSGGTDAVVNLWQVVSPGGDSKVRSPVGSPRGPLESLIRSHTEHEDSVYGLAWSSRDPWVFASISYDGRVVVDSVPNNIRKKLKR